MVVVKVSEEDIPLRLPWHDESSTNITVLDKPFSVRDSKMLSKLQSGYSRGVGHRNHNIHRQTSLGQLLFGCLSEVLSHGHSASVDTDTVDRGVGSSKVDIFENVGREDLRFGNLATSDFFTGNDDGFTTLDVLPIVETQSLSNNVLTSDQIVKTASDTFPGGNAHRSDTVGVSKDHKTKTSNHGHTRVGTDTGFGKITDGSEDVFLIDTELSSLLKVVGKNVKKKLRVRIGVDMPVSVDIKELSQSGGVDHVAVL